MFARPLLLLLFIPGVPAILGLSWDHFWWFCHFDDDNYVNVPKLVKLLGRYDPQENVYLGKPSIPAPLEIPGKDPSSVSAFLHLI
ncbi:unnamed protein product, partial [Notodromas monacha]